MAANQVLRDFLDTDGGARRARIITILDGDDFDANYIGARGEVIRGLTTPLDSDTDFLLSLRRWPATRHGHSRDGGLVAFENFYIDNPPKHEGFEKDEVWEISVISLSKKDAPRGWWLVGVKGTKVQMLEGSPLPMPTSRF